MSYDNFRIEKNILVKYTGSDEHVIIPEHVRAIGAQAFAFNTVVVSVVIPKGVVTIGERAFDNCHNLESVEIPKTVSMIEKNAFSSCKKLDNVVIPEGVPFIANKTFYMCLSLKTVSLPSSVTSISDEAFARCISLEEIAIGDDVIEIGEKAFMECYGLKAVSIGRGVEVIKWNTFASCKSLEKIALTASLREIEYGAFDSCPAITDVYFNEADDLWRQINIKPTRNETLLRASYHYDHTESILSIAAPAVVEEISAEIVEEPVITEEESAVKHSFKVIDEIPMTPIVTPDETPTELTEEPALVEETVVTDVVEEPIAEEPVVTDVVEEAAPIVPAAPAAKKPTVRTTPKSAVSTVSDEFKKGFYQNFLSKLTSDEKEAVDAKADAMTDELFETQSEALFLVPADDAYEFGCVCLTLGKYNMAFRSFLSAAGKGSVGAQYYVGAAFLFGIDTTKKIVDAARWLTKCKKDDVFGEDATRLLIVVDEELDKPENAGLKVKRGNK